MPLPPTETKPRPWGLPWKWEDSAQKRADEAFSPSRSEERRYERKLTAIADQVEKILRSGGSAEKIRKKQVGIWLTPYTSTCFNLPKVPPLDSGVFGASLLTLKEKGRKT